MNSAPGTMPSILLVEDDRISATFLSAALATLPARVHVAEDCAQALAASGPFDAWLIDANLPDGSGTWLLQRLRATDAAARALAHTADATDAMREALLQAGFAEVLVKPLSAQALAFDGPLLVACGTRPFARWQTRRSTDRLRPDLFGQRLPGGRRSVRWQYRRSCNRGRTGEQTQSAFRH